MNIELFKNDLQKVKISGDFKDRIMQALAEYGANNQAIIPVKDSSIWTLKILRPIVLVPLLIILAGCSLFLIFPSVLDAFAVTGCPPEFSDRYYSLIEMDDIAYIYQGNGTLYRYDGSEPMQKIRKLTAEELFTDGKTFFYSKGNHIFQTSLDKVDKNTIVSENQKIALDYVNTQVLIYHFGNHDRYTIMDRNSGEKKQLFESEDEKAYTFNAASTDYAVFTKNSNGQESLYSVNLQDGQKTQVYDGSIRGRVAIIKNTIYFTHTGMVENRTRDFVKEIWFVNTDGEELHQLEISEITYENIQAIVASGPDLLIATDEQYSSHHGKIYLYRISTKTVEILQERIRLIDRLFATNHYYCFYDLGDDNEAGKAYVGQINR